MTGEPRFITLEEAVFFHKEEIRQAGGSDGIRDPEGLEGGSFCSQGSLWQCFSDGRHF